MSTPPRPVAHVAIEDVRAHARDAVADYRQRQAAAGLGAPLLAARKRLQRELVPILGHYISEGEATRVVVAVIAEFLATEGTEVER